MAESLRLGQRLQLDQDRHVVIWSAAPGPGRYWAHLDGKVVLISYSWPAKSSEPIVKLVDA